MRATLTSMLLALAVIAVSAPQVCAQTPSSLEKRYNTFMSLWNTRSTSADGRSESLIEIVPARPIKTDLDQCEIEIRHTAYMLQNGKIAAYDYSEISYDLGEAAIMKPLTLNEDGIVAIGMVRGPVGLTYTDGVKPLVCQRIFMPGWDGPDVERCPEPRFFSKDDTLRTNMADAFQDLARMCRLKKALMLESTLSIVFYTDTVGTENAELADLAGGIMCASERDIKTNIVKEKRVPQSLLWELSEVRDAPSREEALTMMKDRACDLTLIPEYLAQEFVEKHGADLGFQILVLAK